MTRRKMFSRFQLLDPIEVLLTSKTRRGGRVDAASSRIPRTTHEFMVESSKNGKIVVLIFTIFDIRICFERVFVRCGENGKWKIEESLFYNSIVLKRRKITTKRKTFESIKMEDEDKHVEEGNNNNNNNNNTRIKEKITYSLLNIFTNN